MTLHAALKPLQKALATATAEGVQEALKVISPDAVIHMCHPFGDIAGTDVYNTLYAPLMDTMPGLERRDMITLTNVTPEGETWVGCMGNYMGTMLRPWLDIPPTGHLTHMRYHEFFRIEEGRVIQAQIIWDIPEVMMQAWAWPMAPQLGKYLATPAPMTQDGLVAEGDGTATMDHVIAMLTDLCKYPLKPDPAVMQLETYWHPRSNCYGPAGIGTGRGIAGFRNWHQIPFLKAMPDRKLDALGDLMSHWFGQGEYVCETGWPNMRLTVSEGEWMGLTPAGRQILMCSLDFWRVEDGLICENWVLVDLLDVYRQLGVDVFARMRAFNKARNLGPITLPEGEFT